MTPLESRLQSFSPGSLGFLRSVDFEGQYKISQSEARRISLESDTAEMFERVWRDERWWKDSVIAQEEND